LSTKEFLKQHIVFELDAMIFDARKLLQSGPDRKKVKITKKERES
jgi:hypothetical protein